MVKAIGEGRPAGAGASPQGVISGPVPSTPPPASDPAAAAGPADRLEAQDKKTAGGAAGSESQLQVPRQEAARTPARQGENWALLAAQLAAIIAKHPHAEPRARARLFAKAILRRPRWASFFGDSSSDDLEALCNLIGDAVDRSPHFAELVQRACHLDDQPPSAL